MAKSKYPGVESLGGGKYRIRVQVKDPKTGKMIEADRRIEATSAEAAALARASLKKELAAPKRSSASSTVGDLAHEWLRVRRAALRPDGGTRLAESTLERWEGSIRRYIAAPELLGKYQAALLERHDVERWRDALASGFRANTVNSALKLLRTILQDYGVTAADRVRGLRVDDTRINDDEPNALSEAQLSAFFEAAKRHTPQHYALLLVLFTTGQRIGSALALKWSDIDEATNEIVFRKLKAGRGKTERLPLLPEVREALESHRRWFNTRQRESGLIFPARTGKRASLAVLRKAFVLLSKESGLKIRFTPHGLRRTAAVMYRRAAGSVVAKKILGHLTDAMHEHYSHVAPDEKREATEKVLRGLRIVNGESSGEDSGEGKNE